MSNTIKIKPIGHKEPVLTLYEADRINPKYGEAHFVGWFFEEERGGRHAFPESDWELVPAPFEFPTVRGAVIGERDTDNLWVRREDGRWVLIPLTSIWSEGDFTTVTGNPDLYVLYPGEEVAE